MTALSFDEIHQRLPAEALDLFEEMAAAHLASSGDRRFMRADTFGGSTMTFTGTGDSIRHTFEGFDPGSLDDLVTQQLLSVRYSQRRATPNYRVTGDGQCFYQWLMEQKGSSIQQVEEETLKLIESEPFATAHSACTHHLGEAFELLWSGKGDPQTVSEIGDHLRKALMDLTSDLVGTSGAGHQEKPIQRLEQHIERADLGDRERQVLIKTVELAEATLRLDHRLNHVRDEADRGRPESSWPEVRTAAFTTAFVCYQLHERL